MTSFKTKTRAIILSTLLICSKYSSIDNKITFFEPVYAIGPITINNLQDLHNNYLNNVNKLNLQKTDTLKEQDCTEAVNSLQYIESNLKNFIDPDKIDKLNNNVAKKKHKDIASATLQSDINKKFNKLITSLNSQDSKKANQFNIELYALIGRLRQKIERKSNTSTPTSTPVSTLLHGSYLIGDNNESAHVTNSQNSSTASISTNKLQSSDQHAQVTPPESQPIKHEEDNTVAENSDNGNNEDNDVTNLSDFLFMSDCSDDKDSTSVQNSDHGSISSTIVSSNGSDNQTQSSDSGIQSTTEDDDIGADDNDDNFIPSSPPVLNNNTAMIIHNSDDSSHNHFTPILHSTVYKARTLVFPQISRKVSSNRTTPKVIGASFSSNLQRLKRYELEAKYLYSTTTTPQTNGNSKSNIHGLLVNLKRQITSQFTAGIFYSPTSTNTTFINKVNNNSTSGCMDHLFGVYTSYAITPVTYLSNQIALGITTTDNNIGSNNNKSSTKKYPEYLMVDSFISHKINLDTTKIISPELGISYYQSSAHIPYDIGYINNLSLNIGIKFQYKYKYSNFELCPSVKINHVHPLYTNIIANVIDLSNRANALPVNLLRDLQSAFDPHSSIRFALSIRHNSIRLESGYGFTTYHNVEHSYTHTFFAKLNLAL